MGHSGKPRVKADLLHFVRASHEEVDDPVGHHAVGEALDDVMETPPHVQAVAVVHAWLNGDGLPVGGSVACCLAHGASYLDRDSKTDTGGQSFPPQAARSSAFSGPYQVQGGPLQHIHHLLQLGAGGEDEVVVHPQHVLGGHLRDGQVSSGEPALREAEREREKARERQSRDPRDDHSGDTRH